jgi:hypothetical protein
MDEESEIPAVRYPRFDHGEDLQIVVSGNDIFEFRSDALGEYLRADNAVYVEDVT